jgi:hypothetical protein
MGRGLIPHPTEDNFISAETTTRSFVSMVETFRNSRVWNLTFNVTKTWPSVDGYITEVIPYTISLRGNNANQDGRYVFTDGPLEGYTLIYDIRGNGSNIRALELIAP